MKLLESLKWRYAAKKFDPTKKVDEEDLKKIKEVVQLSASSYGLQPYKIIIIKNKAIRAKLKPASWGQDKVTDASHLVVFCNYTTIEDKTIEDYIRLRADVHEVDFDKIKGYGTFIKEKLGEKTDSEKQIWAQKQTYLALGNLLTACADLKIDACPMEGFEPEKYNEILGLSEKGLCASVIAAIGYRAKDDLSQNERKVRKPLEALFELK